MARGLEGVEGELVKVAASKNENKKNTAATESAPLPPFLFGRRFVFAGPLMRNAQLRSQTLKNPLEHQLF